ncbi:MAG: hypothetical protein K8I02_03490, partial [Candidatus Methylomirabilis sp.]|nr:hypothetical protein [Deltaproteobacteria bacterium]
MSTSSSPSDARLRWTLLGALLVLTLGVQVASFDYFVMPGPDFLDLRATAERFARGEAPLSFRVAPLYPALIAALSPFAGGWDPLLRAAEGWNVLFAVLTTYALFRVGERFLGRWGFLVPLLHFLHPAVTGEMLAQPLVEQTLLVLTVWTVLLAIGRSPWAWLAAALASVARYEGVGLLAGLALLELLERRPLPKIALRSALASVPLALWLGWSMVASGTLNPYLKEVATGENQYLEDAAPASRTNFAKMAAFSF